MSTGISNIGYTAKLHDHCAASIRLLMLNYLLLITRAAHEKQSRNTPCTLRRINKLLIIND